MLPIILARSNLKAGSSGGKQMRSQAWLRRPFQLGLRLLQPFQKYTHGWSPRRPTGSEDVIENASPRGRIRWSRIFRLYAPIATLGLATSATYHWYFQKQSDNIINPLDFTPYTLKFKEPVSSSSSIFTLRPASGEDHADVYADAWRKGIWSVQIKQPQLQIARSYTPLPPPGCGEEVSNHDLRFLIRRETQGEVSGYLHKLPLDAVIDLRGPQLEYEIPGEVDEVVFLAGGTGIAPALQVVHTLLEHRASQRNAVPKMTILWANRSQEDALDQPVQAFQPKDIWKFWSIKCNSAENRREKIEPPTTCILTEQIRSLKTRYPDNLTLQYFVDEQHSFINRKAIESRLNHKPKKETAATAQPGRNRKLIIVSGPDGFVNYIAGPKTWQEGREFQGPVGGLLSKVDTTGWEVQKL